jgi:membrane protein
MAREPRRTARWHRRKSSARDHRKESGTTPPAGWKATLLRVKANIGRHNVSLIAAGLALYALLATFPALFAIVSMYGLVTDAGRIAEQTQSLTSFLPTEAAEIIQTALRSIAEGQTGKLGIGAFVGFLLSLWSARKGMEALMIATNIVFGGKETRGFVKRIGVSLALTVAAVIGFLVILLLAVGAPLVWEFLGLSDAIKTALGLVQWVVLWLVIVLGLAIVYRFAPSRANAHWRWITVGSATAASLWVVGSLLFSLYVRNFGSYGETYGALASVVILLMWFYLSSYVVLIGAEIDATIEKQTSQPPAERPASHEHGLQRETARAPAH